MKNKIASGIIGIVAISGGVDASILNEQPIPLTEISLKEEVVTLEQKGNVIESQLPWKDQVGFKVKYDLGEPTVAERFTDKRSKQVITETVDFGDGGFKIDVLLNEKPNTNTFCYTIEGAENYDFFYQPALTAEEIAEGSSRPENIVGSYAVYHKTLRNNIIGRANYATGKVMHIPRPQVWEMGNESVKYWADLSYADGQLCVTAPQEFLDTATYPVRIDPTFGYTSQGASDNSSCALAFDGLGRAQRADSITGTLTSASVYTKVSGGVANTYRLQVFSHNGGTGKPDTALVSGTPTTYSNTTYQLKTQSLSLALSGTTYWVSSDTESGGNSCQVAFDAGGTSNYGATIDSDSGGVWTLQTNLYSAYATYDAALPASTPTATINGAVLNGARI